MDIVRDFCRLRKNCKDECLQDKPINSFLCASSIHKQGQWKHLGTSPCPETEFLGAETAFC